MKVINRFFFGTVVLIATSLICVAQTVENTKPTKFDAELAKKLGADEYGMKNYVFVILKTGPNDAKYQGEERKQMFAGHFSNMGKMAEDGKLVVAGPFNKNDRNYRGIFILTVTTIEEAEKLVANDPTVKAGILVAEMTPWYGSASLIATPEIHKKIAKSNP